jgi:hypothetical protein
MTHRLVPRAIERAAQLADAAYRRALRGPGYLNSHDAARCRTLASALRAAADALDDAATRAETPLAERPARPQATTPRLQDRPRLLRPLPGESAP